MAYASNPDPQTALHVPSDPTIPLSGKPIGFSSTQASVLLDMVRGLAAVAVMLGHWRNLFFVDYSQLPAHRRWFAIPYALTTSGHEAVIVFFVLSGYLISGSVFRLFERGQWSWRSYLLHRLVRLWIVLLPGLLLAALLDFIGLHLTRVPAVTLYHGLYADHLLGDVRPSFNLRTWLGNLIFLQGIYVPTFGSDNPLWSLANEFWYYLLFPLGLLALRKGTRAGARVTCVAGFCAICAGLNGAILLLFPVWLLGTLLAVLPTPRLSGFWRLGATVVYVPLIFRFARPFTTHGVLADEVFGLLTFGYVYVLLSARQASNEQNMWTRMWRVLARFSYTLYVVHLPLLVLMAALMLGMVRWVPDMKHLGLGLMLLMGGLSYAYGLASVTEFRTDRVRKAIERRLPEAGT